MEMEKISKLKAEESIEFISRKFRVIKAIAKIAGIGLIFFGLLITILSYAMEYLIDDFDKLPLEEQELYFLIPFWLGWLFFGGGFLACFFTTIYTLPKQDKVTDYLDQYYKNKEKPQQSTRFLSFRVSRLVAGVLLLILGLLGLFILTGALAHDNAPYGEVIVLGGPSFYYIVAWFPHMFGIGFLLYTIFYSHRAHIASSENNFYYNGFKKNSTINVIVPKEEIEMIRYQNNKIGVNHVWIFTLVPFMVLTAIAGVYLFMAPLMTDPTQAILFLVFSILEIAALYYIALRPASYLRITTQDSFYETCFEPYKKDVPDIPLSNVDQKGKIHSEFMTKNNINPTHRSYTKLLIGIFFVASGLIMMTLYFVVGLLGGFYTMVSIVFGAVLVIKAFSQDFSDKNGVIVDYDKGTKLLNFEQTRGRRFLKINTLQPTGLEVVEQFRSTNIWEILLIVIFLPFGTIETVQGWVLSTTPALIINSVITMAFLCIVYFLVFVYLCFPINKLRVDTPTLKYELPVSLTEGQSRFLSGVLSADLKKTFLLRCVFLALICVGAIVGTIIYLYPFFFA